MWATGEGKIMTWVELKGQIPCPYKTLYVYSLARLCLHCTVLFFSRHSMSRHHGLVNGSSHSQEAMGSSWAPLQGQMPDQIPLYNPHLLRLCSTVGKFIIVSIIFRINQKPRLAPGSRSSRRLVLPLLRSHPFGMCNKWMDG